MATTTRTDFTIDFTHPESLEYQLRGQGRHFPGKEIGESYLKMFQRDIEALNRLAVQHFLPPTEAAKVRKRILDAMWRYTVLV